MNWMLFDFNFIILICFFGGCVCVCVYAPPSICNMSGLSKTMHVHVLGRHVHYINRFGIVISWSWLCWLPTFTRVYHLVWLLDWSVWAIWYITCCVRRCGDLLCVDGCKCRVGVAMCQIHGLGKVCCWGWDMWVARRCYFGGFLCHVHLVVWRNHTCICIVVGCIWGYFMW